MSYIYIASPYTHPKADVMEERYEIVSGHTAFLLNKGIHVFSPIVHCHELAKTFGLPRHAEFWNAYNVTMLRAAGQLLVLTMEGWHESRGVKHEIYIAELLHIPLKYETPNNKERRV